MEKSKEIIIYKPNIWKAVISGLFWTEILFILSIGINLFNINRGNLTRILLFVAVIVGLREVIKGIKKNKSLISIPANSNDNINQTFKSSTIIPFFAFFYFVQIEKQDKYFYFFIDMNKANKALIEKNTIQKNEVIKSMKFQYVVIRYFHLAYFIIISIIFYFINQLFMSYV